MLFWEICTHDTPVRGQLRPLEIPRECSEQVAALIEECCHFDPDKRPSAREVRFSPSELPSTFCGVDRNHG